MIAIALMMQQAVPPPPSPPPPGPPPSSQARPADAPATPDVVVTARIGPPLPDRFADRLRAACWDPLRRRTAVAPPPGEGWVVLPELARSLPAAAPDAIWELPADERGRTLTLLVERRAGPWRTVSTRCTLVAQGGRDHAAIRQGVSALTGGMTRRHVGKPDGVAVMPGWRQWLATRTPQRGAAGWTADPGRRRDSYTVVIDPAFYARADHVAVELRARDDGQMTVASVMLTEQPPLVRRPR